MTVYFSEMDFNKNIKNAFYSFCEKHDLTLYNTTNGISIFLDNKIKPSYLANTYPLTIEVFLGISILEKNSHWNRLHVPISYLKPLTESLYKSLEDKNTFIILHKYITNFIHPKDVCLFLVEYSKEELEKFLTTKKSTKGKHWNSDDIFSFISPLMLGKTPSDKAIVLNKILNNNKLFINSLDFKKKLYNFVNLYIDEDYKIKFSDYYKDVEKVEKKETPLFNSSSKTIIIDINKVAFLKCMPKTNSSYFMNDLQINNFFKTLIDSMKYKNIKEYLGIDSANVYQKQQQYENFRLIIDINKDKHLEEKTVQEFIKLFIDSYNHTFKRIPDKQQVPQIAEKIIMVLSLNRGLVEKPSSIKLQKI